MSAEPIHLESQLRRLPLVTLYLTERCNSRCASCDYWRHGRRDLDLEAARRLLPSLARLQTRVALISGGEPLLNPEWRAIAELLREAGLTLWLLTSGLSLAKHVRHVARLFQAVTVSLDGCDGATYAAIRGLDAFEAVCAGVRAAAAAGLPVGVRVTVQRANYRQLRELVGLAHRLGAHQISFFAVDVANPHAFARRDDFAHGLALEPQDLPGFARVLDELERDCAGDLRSGFIAESPRRLRRMLDYFAAVCGAGAFPPVRCNVTEFSAVIGADARLSPCFFIPGPAPLAEPAGLDLEAALNSPRMTALRHDIRRGARPECARCVCSLWREPEERATRDFLPRRTARA